MFVVGWVLFERDEAGRGFLPIPSASVKEFDSAATDLRRFPGTDEVADADAEPPLSLLAAECRAW